MSSFTAIFAPLFTAFRYLLIHQRVKVNYDWWIPLCFTIILFIWQMSLGGELNIVSAWGNKAGEISGLLIAFNTTALAAISTFSSTRLEQLFSDDPARLKRTVNGKKGVIENLSRRRFLCYLFGYLTFLSIILYFSHSAFEWLVAQSFDLLSVRSWACVLGSFVYVFLCFQLIITLLLGLHFLTDRIHRDT